MDRARIFLKTPLFTPGRRGALSVPYARARVLDGAVTEAPGGLEVVVTAWWDDDGNPLDDVGPATLILPVAKIDHIAALDEA